MKFNGWRFFGLVVLPVLFWIIVVFAFYRFAWAMAGDPPGCWITPCPVPIQGQNPNAGCYISPCPLAPHSLGAHSI